MILKESVFMHKIKLGITGLGRGLFIAHANQSLQAFEIIALCDTDPARIGRARAVPGLEQAAAYSDYEEMLDRSGIEAVLVASPMNLHAGQSIAALQRGIHVLSEVTAGVTVEECRRLAEVCHSSGAAYMFAENMNYVREVMLIAELVRAGLFGATFYAEAEYIHELKAMQVSTPWRRRWHTGVNGIVYGTHSLGPVLAWMPGERVVEVCCAGSGHHHLDANGKPFALEDTCVMLAKTSGGGLIKIRLDFLTDRPGGHYFVLQGNDGSYESARSEEERQKVWLRSQTAERKWLNLEELAAEFLPADWREYGQEAGAAGHGGSDYFVARDFARVIRGEIANPLDIHAALDMTLPGLISQQSIAQGGAWLPVPDSREW